MVLVFGGYCSVPWGSFGHQIDSQAFLFLIRSKNSVMQQNQCPIVLKCIKPTRAIYQDAVNGPLFGLIGHDLHIGDKCNHKYNNNWICPSGTYQYCRSLCGGRREWASGEEFYYFSVKDYEIIEIN